MKLYNTLTKIKEELQPIYGKKINIYVCGLTVYDSVHLGHAKLYISFDVIIRYLKFLGYQVTYVRNITDIDDKIINKSNNLEVDFNVLVDKYIDEMHADFSALGLLEPDYEPRVTEHIPEIIQIIETLLLKEYAYISDSGDIYFNIAKYEQYGALSKRDLSGQDAGNRVAVTADKKSNFDFVLWKMAKEGEPAWESPWGVGRPGWHIECSAMSMKYLGDYFDIHGGGYDLLFPHHENELAQSCCATERDFVKYWMHIGYLNINAEKMSKSLGNHLVVNNILQDFHPEAIRMFMISSHYRSQQNFTIEALQAADETMIGLYDLLTKFDLSKLHTNIIPEYKKKFVVAMNDDINTCAALAVIFEIAHHVNNRNDQYRQVDLFSSMIELGKVLGLLSQEPKHYLQYGISLEHAENYDDLLQRRDNYRKQKDWHNADLIRDELLEKGISIQDTVNGTFWRRSAKLK